MKSGGNVVCIQRHQALTLVSSAQWVHYLIRKGELGVNEAERHVALADLRAAIDAASAQLERAPRHGRFPWLEGATPWWGALAAILAVFVATLLIEGCHLLGMPRTVAGLYIPVCVGVALFIGRWPALLGCLLAFVVNDVLFVHPWRFTPAPDQIAALGVVVLACLAFDWLTRVRSPLGRWLPPIASALSSI